MVFIICNGFPEFDAFIDSVLPGDEYNIVDITVDFDFITSVIPKMAAQIIAIEM